MKENIMKGEIWAAQLTDRPNGVLLDWSGQDQLFTNVGGTVDPISMGSGDVYPVLFTNQGTNSTSYWLVIRISLIV